MSATSALGAGPKAVTNPITPNSGASNNPRSSTGQRGASTLKRILSTAAGRQAQENINTETVLATGMVAIFCINVAADSNAYSRFDADIQLKHFAGHLSFCAAHRQATGL